MAVGRGEHIRAVSVIIVESRTIAFMAESTLTDLREVECKLFRNRPAMSRVKRSSPTRIPNASQGEIVFVFCEFRFNGDRVREFRGMTVDVAVTAHTQGVEGAVERENLINYEKRLVSSQGVPG